MSHTKYGEISGNVAPYVLDSAKLDEMYGHARRVFLDRSNMVKSTSRWLLPTTDCGDGSDTESAFRTWRVNETSGAFRNRLNYIRRRTSSSGH